MKYEFDAPSVHQLGKEGSLFIFSSFSKLFHFPHDSKSRRSECFWPLASISCACCSFQSKVRTFSRFWAEEKSVCTLNLYPPRANPPLQYTAQSVQGLYAPYIISLRCLRPCFGLDLSPKSSSSFFFPSPRGLPPSLTRQQKKTSN